MLFFDAKLNSKKTVDLTWQTLSERDNDYFTVDKSVDGITWNYLGTVDGSGTTVIPQAYYLEDLNPFYGVNYYRLKQTDFNGQYNFADIKTVELKQDNLYFSYPNPANNSVNIYGENISNLNIEIYDNLGKLVQLNKKTIANNQIEVQTDQLANGMYYLKISDATLIDVQKLLIKH